MLAGVYLALWALQDLHQYAMHACGWQLMSRRQERITCFSVKNSLLLLQVSGTADSFWQTLLEKLAEGSPTAGKLLEQKLSSEALSRMGARSVPSAAVSAMTKLLHASPGIPLRKQVWKALRNVLKQLLTEGPPQSTSPSKVLALPASRCSVTNILCCILRAAASL